MGTVLAQSRMELPGAKKMNRNIGSIVAIGLMMMAATLLWMSFQAKTTQTQTARIRAALDETEREMGTYDSLTARDMPVTQRVRNVTQQMQQRARESRRLLDSLTRAERQDLGDPTVQDSNATGYNSDLGYSALGSTEPTDAAERQRQ
jgi:hypothetical protein